MKIIDYQYSDNEWEFGKVEFQDVNLIVGDSGTGKTRLLNSIFNLGTSVVHKKAVLPLCSWNVTLGTENDKYFWSVSTELIDGEVVVANEELHINGKKIMERDKAKFSLDGKEAFKLPKNEMSITTLREEDVIKPLYDGFSRILRRRFFADDLERNSGLQAINNKLLNQIGMKKDLNDLYKSDLGLNLRLSILKDNFPDIYNKIIGLYLEAFDFIQEVRIIPSDKLESIDILFVPTPVFCIRERNINKWIRLDEMASGLQKSLLILTDLLALPEDVIYLIDEYENSLGINAINILPNILLSENLKRQIFVTSHHPYIISKFPVENWYVAHRKGSKVIFDHGEKLVSRYGTSKQDKYFQLVNDPFYAEGIE
jgi:hypothetical protein